MKKLFKRILIQMILPYLVELLKNYVELFVAKKKAGKHTDEAAKEALDEILAGYTDIMEKLI